MLVFSMFKICAFDSEKFKFIEIIRFNRHSIPDYRKIGSLLCQIALICDRTKNTWTMQKDLKALFNAGKGLDERSVSSLTKALEKNNLEGFDYIEFKQSLGRLRAMDMDEATAYKSAFVTASTVGLTKEKLLSTAEHYKKVLFKEKQQFDEALQKQMEQRVESKRSEVEKMKKQVEEYKAKIKQLEEKIAKAQSTIDHADEHIQAARDKIESTKDAFEDTLRSILEEIDQDIQNINNLL